MTTDATLSVVAELLVNLAGTRYVN